MIHLDTICTLFKTNWRTPHSASPPTWTIVRAQSSSSTSARAGRLHAGRSEAATLRQQSGSTGAAGQRYVSSNSTHHQLTKISGLVYSPQKVAKTSNIDCLISDLIRTKKRKNLLLGSVFETNGNSLFLLFIEFSNVRCRMTLIQNSCLCFIHLQTAAA